MQLNSLSTKWNYKLKQGYVKAELLKNPGEFVFVYGKSGAYVLG